MYGASWSRFLEVIGRLVLDARMAARWTQEELERRTGISQSRISRIEHGRCRALRVVDVDRLFVALGVRYSLDATFPVSDGRVRDSVHARCGAYAERRLTTAGWLVRREVEIGGDRSRGWIDVLAFHPASRLLLVLEIKTELHDIGAIERSLNWYVREAPRAASRFGWRATSVASALILLETAVNDRALRASRSAIDVAFPGRAVDLRSVVAGTNSPAMGRSLAMIDPRSRRQAWLVASVRDGRRSAPPFDDYQDAARRLAKAGAPRARSGPS